MSPAVVVILRLIHILSGVFWVGSIIFLGRFVMPTIRTMGPAGGAFMTHLTTVLKLPRAQFGAALLTILSGLSLEWHDSIGLQSEWLRSRAGMAFGTGGGLAIIAFLIGVSVSLPASKRMGALLAEIQAKGGTPDAAQAAEVKRLQQRLGNALRAVMLLLVLATAAMAVARYV